MIDLLNSKPTEQSNWKPWPVIPLKMTVAAGYCSWSVKADEDPAADRLIMPGGAKLVIEQIDMPHDAAVRKHSEGIRKAEAAKTKRRDDFLQSQSQNDQPDHWLAYRANKGASKGTPRPSQQNESNSELAALKAQVGALTARVDRQDGRLDNIEYRRNVDATAQGGYGSSTGFDYWKQCFFCTAFWETPI